MFLLSLVALHYLFLWVTRRWFITEEEDEEEEAALYPAEAPADVADDTRPATSSSVIAPPHPCL